MPSIMLLQTLAAWPLPGPPAWMILRPICSSSGFAVLNAAAGPPTMKVRVAASAPPAPPDTGASRIRQPAFFAAAATRPAAPPPDLQPPTRHPHPALPL